MKMKSKKECKKIGIMMAHGEIFHSTMCRRQAEVPMVFMVLTFVDEEQLDKMAEDNIVAFYEETSKRQYRTINGMPTFFSCGMLSKDENKIVMMEYKKEVARMKKLEEKAE